VSASDYLRRLGDGQAVLSVRVTPRARQPGIDGPVVDAAGAAWLAVRVTEPPDSGRATRAVEALIADRCALPRRAVQLLSGAGSRWKRLRIDADAAAVRHSLDVEPRMPGTHGRG
jgi:uncharacterized protein YggU (UPF0235/DUF167 family)